MHIALVCLVIYAHSALTKAKDLYGFYERAQLFWLKRTQHDAMPRTAVYRGSHELQRHRRDAVEPSLLLLIKFKYLLQHG